MKLKLKPEFKKICSNILNKNKTEIEWAEIESDDLFQNDSFCGGFDATEIAFCFSYYDTNNNEYWFQLTLNQIKEVIDGSLIEFDMREAE